jgi:hypothetical protein
MSSDAGAGPIVTAFEDHCGIVPDLEGVSPVSRAAAI